LTHRFRKLPEQYLNPYWQIAPKSKYKGDNYGNGGSAARGCGD
jgi:hypothetical protein